ncbi:MAG TPA: TonB family protein [Saprospiraceae bacterium]|nr:TonB family protein [Saprospiraceae bacterium]
MKNLLQRIVLFLFPKECNGLNNSFANQLIYSQLKNRLVMMTQKPSSVLAKLKFSGVLPILLMALLIFSFRAKDQTGTASSKVYDIYKDGLKVDGFEITEQPVFPGCEKVNAMEKVDCSQKKMFEYVAQHLQYPEDMKANKTEGKVYVKFVITEKGDVADVEVQKSLTPSADRAALDIVNGMNKNVGKWTPGSKDGKPVAMDMVLPISFVLGTPSDQRLTTSNSPGTTAIAISQTGDEPFTYVEHMPTFPEGQEAMYKFIYERIKYPAAARENGISGVVIIQFVVSKEGDIQNAKVLRGIGGGCNEEALRVINEMPRWNPGQHDGRNVPVTFTMPIKFVLQSKNEEIKNSAVDTIEGNKTLQQTTVIAEKESSPKSINSSTNSLHLSPNPARDYIDIDLFENVKTIAIFKVSGEQVAKFEANPAEVGATLRVDVSKYPAGQYSVQVVSSSETRSAMFTIIR